MVEMAAQQCECDNTIELYPLKWLKRLNCMFYVFYHNKKKGTGPPYWYSG